MKKQPLIISMIVMIAAVNAVPAAASWSKFRKQMANPKCWGVVATLGESHSMMEGCKNS